MRARHHIRRARSMARPAPWPARSRAALLLPAWLLILGLFGSGLPHARAQVPPQAATGAQPPAAPDSQDDASLPPAPPELRQEPGPERSGASANPWRAAAGCERGKVSPRDYNRCLNDALRASEQALEAEISNALAVIDARADLFPTQRTRWKNLFDEAQSRFLIYRNFDCQSVAPFEGPRGIGNFEQRAICMIESNARRGRDLRARYGEAPTPSGEAYDVAEDRPSTWTHRTPPPVN